MENVMQLLPFFIILAIAVVVIVTESIKKIDKKNILKGYRIYIPLKLSFVTAFLLKIGNFYVSEQMWFWWVVIFGFSIFGYEAILRKVTDALNKEEKSK